jgi:alkylation response protein AidB-like acyl-CoA dehydrogenase
VHLGTPSDLGHHVSSQDAALDAVAALAPLVERHAAQAERDRRPHPDVHAGLVDTGLYKLWAPVPFGGMELDLPASLRVFEAAARVDGAFGWTVAIGTGGGLFGAFLEPAAAEAVFGPPGALVAGSGAPGGVAEVRDGGVRASGRWRYASGARTATTFTANCVLQRGGAPLPGPGGQARVRAIAVPPRAVEVLDTWDPFGLRATDSQDIAIASVDVPDAFTFSAFEPPRQPGPLYRHPFMATAEASFAALAVGLGHRVVDLFDELAEHKVPYGFDVALGRLPEAARRAASARARLDAARQQLDAAVGASWAAVAGGGTPDGPTLAAVGHATRRCARDATRAAGEVADVAGMSLLPLAAPLGRAWRDLHALVAHAVFSPLRDVAAAGLDHPPGG